MRAIVTVGVSASGKSTFANQYIRNRNDWAIVCRDDIRWSILGEENWSKWNWKKEKKVTEIQSDMINRCASEEKNIILSDTFLNTDRRNQMIKRLESLDYEVELKFFDIDMKTAIERDRMRPNSVGEHVIVQQFKQIEKEPYVPKNGQLSVIFDIDGTVAKMIGRHPFQWDKVGEDEPIRHVAEMACGYNRLGYEIIFMSGRDGVCYDDTLDWLNQLFDFEFELFMRSPSDSRPDEVVKRELFNKHIRDQYNVIAAVDDRHSIAKLWTVLGLNLVWVGEQFKRF